MMGTQGNFRLFLTILLAFCLALPMLLPGSLPAQPQPDPQGTELSPDDPLAPLVPPESGGKGTPADREKMKSDALKWAEQMREQAQKLQKQFLGNKDVEKKLNERRKEREEARKNAKPEKLPVSVTIRSSWGNRWPDCKQSGHADLTLDGNLYRDDPSAPFYLARSDEPIKAEIDFEDVIVCESDTNLVDSTPRRKIFRGGVELKSVRGGVTLSPDDPLAPLTPTASGPQADISLAQPVDASTGGGWLIADPVPWFAGVSSARATLAQDPSQIPQPPPAGGAYVRRGSEPDWLRVTGMANFDARYVSGLQGTSRQGIGFQLMLEQDKAHLEGNSSWGTQNHTVPPGEIRYGIANGNGSVGHILEVKRFPEKFPNSWMDHKVAWLIGKSDRPDVTLTGCAHLMKGGMAKLDAEGNPPGGTYEWRSDAAEVLSVSGAGSSAVADGVSPGRATVKVEYRTPNGRSASGTLSGSVSELRAVNGGAPIPPIALRDENGNEVPPTSVSVVQAPPDGETLRFPVADEGIAKVVNQGQSLLIQGIREGRTTTQARTACGDKVGPVIPLEVVRCSKETIERMKAKEKVVSDRLRQNVHDAQKVMENKEFKRAARDVGKDTFDAWLKISEAVAAAGGALAHGDKMVQALERAVTAANAGWSGLHAMGEEMNKVLEEQMIMLAAGPFWVSYEYGHSIGRWLGDLAAIITTGYRTASFREKIEKDLKELEDLVNRRVSICGPESTEEPGKTGPPTQGEEPPTPKDPSTPKAPPTPKEPPEPPKPPSPAGDDGIPPEQPPDSPEPPIDWDPPFEPPPPRSPSGLPMGCGCGTYAVNSWGTSAKGLVSIATDLRRTFACGNDFMNSLPAYEQNLKKLIDAGARAQEALGLPEEQGIPALQAAYDKEKTSVEEIKGFVRDGDAIQSSQQGCGDTVRKAAELITTSTPQSIMPEAVSR